MKYLFLTNGAAHWPTLTKEYKGAGSYNWPKAMDGDVRLWPELKRNPIELLDYGLIHINLAADDIGLAAEIRPYLKGTSTKLIVNADYSINYMDKNVHIHEFIADIQAADYAFGTEPTQANLIHYISRITIDSQIKIMVLPHPVDIKYLNSKWLDYGHRTDTLVFHYHKYDGHLDIPWLLCYDLPVLNKVVLGYTKHEWNVKDMPEWGFWPFMRFEQYIDALKFTKYGLEYRTHKASSRFVCEAAALGIPVVTTKHSFMGQLIFPNLCAPMEDFTAIRSHLDMVTKNDEYRLDTAKVGLENVEKFNFENSKKSMLRLIE